MRSGAQCQLGADWMWVERIDGLRAAAQLEEEYEASGPST